MTEQEKLDRKLQIAIESLQRIIEQGDISSYLHDPNLEEEDADVYQEGVDRGKKIAALEAEGAMLLIEDMDEPE